MTSSWTRFERVGAAICSFAANGEHQISLTVGDQLLIKESADGWYRGVVIRTGRSGIFPSLCVHLCNVVVDPVLVEINTVLREWHAMLKTYYREHKMEEFNMMKERLAIMFEKYHKIMGPTIDPIAREQLKKEILKMVEQGRKLLGLDIIVRTPAGEPADEGNTPIISLYHMYKVASREVRNRMLGRSASTAVPAFKRNRVLTMTNLTFMMNHNNINANGTTNSLSDSQSDVGPPPTGEEADNMGNQLTHLFMELKIFMCSVGEEAELYFSLYRHSEGRPVTEEFAVELTSQGMPHDVSRIGRLFTIFPNIPVREIEQGDLCLLCRLFRRGKMQVDGKKGPRSYRRPFAGAVLALNKKLQQGEHEITIPIFASANELSFSSLPEGVISNSGIADVPKAKGVCIGLHWYRGELATVLAANPKLKDVCLTKRLCFPDIIVPGTNRNDLYVTLEGGDFLQDRKTSSKNIEVVIQVRAENGECIRNSILLGSGLPPRDEFKSYVLYHTNSPKWMESFGVSVPLELWPKAHLYIVFRHCTSAESSEKGAFGFAFLRLINEDGTALANKIYTVNSYKINKGAVTNAYTTIDSSYLKESEVAIQNDGKGGSPGGRLVLRKGEVCKLRTLLSSTKLTQNYALLSLLSWKGEPNEMGDIIKKFTFVDMAEVMKFVPETLNGLFNMLVMEHNTLRNRPSRSSNPPPTTQQVYDAIVHVISLFVDDKKGQLPMRSVLDCYVKSYFHFPDAHHPLLACLKHYFTTSSAPAIGGGASNGTLSHQSKSIATLKALEFLLKLVVKSRNIKAGASEDGGSVKLNSNSNPNPNPRFSNANANANASANAKKSLDASGDEIFKTNVLGVFDALNNLMKLKGKGFVGAQTMAIRNFASVISDLEQLFTPQELSHILARFISSIQYSDDLKLLNTEKLFFVYNLLSSSPFYKNNNDVIRILNPTLMQTIKAHLGGLAVRVRKTMAGSGDTLNASFFAGKDSPPPDRQTTTKPPSAQEDELTQCTFILYIVIDTLQARMRDDTNVLRDLYSILPELYHITLAPSNWPGEWRLNLVTVLVNVFHLMKPNHLTEFVGKLHSSHRCDFLQKVYDGAAAMINAPYSATHLMYPENWFSLTMSQHSIVLKMVAEAHVPLLAGLHLLGRGNAGEIHLWKSAVQTQVQYLMASALQVENFAKSKQSLILEGYGDLRLKMIEWLRKTWHALGANQSLMLPQLVESLLELMLSDALQVREVGLEMYYSLLEREYQKTGSFQVVETQTIETIDRITAQDDQQRVDTNFKPFFTRGLSAKFHEEDSPINQQGLVFLNDITQLLSLLLALRTLPKGEAYEDDRTIATMKLMAYLKQTDRKDTYVKYVHQLCHQHVQSHNYTEAGLTLLLHAELLSWSTTDHLSALLDPSFAAETHAQRKEWLYLQTIDHLDKAREWERAIVLISALKALYEDVTFEYGKLSDILSREACIFRNIVSVDRFFCEYFRVGYYGRGFDTQIQGKEYVYRGFELERVADFVQRILMKFPHAILLNYTELPPPEVLNGEGQFLQIFSVKPSPPIILPGGAHPSTAAHSKALSYVHPSYKMPLSAQKYHQNNNINTFIYSKPVRKAQDKNNEHKNLWVNMHFFITEDTFPTIHRRSEIVRHHEVEVSPVDNALTVMNSKNSELREIIERYQKGGESNISPLTMILKGVISADVGGGTKMYRDAFFSKEFAVAHPEKMHVVQQLRLSVGTQVSLLEKGLALHKEICTSEISALQLTLEQQLDDMKATVVNL